MSATQIKTDGSILKVFCVVIQDYPTKGNNVLELMLLSPDKPFVALHQVLA